jgi:hypothetical protein
VSDWKIRCPAGTGLSLHQDTRPENLWSPTNSLLRSTKGCFLGFNQLKRETDQLPLFNAEVKNAWSFPSTIFTDFTASFLDAGIGFWRNITKEVTNVLSPHIILIGLLLRHFKGLHVMDKAELKITLIKCFYFCKVVSIRSNLLAETDKCCHKNTGMTVFSNSVPRSLLEHAVAQQWNGGHWWKASFKDDSFGSQYCNNVRTTILDHDVVNNNRR